MNEPVPLPVSHATASPEAVAALVAARYDLRRPPTCALLRHGFNDSYLVATDAGERFVLRVSGRRARGPADVAAETAFLAHLDAAGVPVAAAVPTRGGALFTTAVLPDGPRAAVLFRHAEGRRPDPGAPEDARAQGVTLARVHQAADGFPGRGAGRYRLDLDHLLHRPVAAVLALDLDAPHARRDMPELAARLGDALGRVDRELARTRCHGDCHGSNARIATAGPRAGQAVFFDFDDGGFGYLAYDLAVHLWAQVSFGQRRHAAWHAFRAGYQSVRPVAPADEAAVHLFVPVRHLWLMGEYAGRTAVRGCEALSAAWLEREVAFLLAWERDRLSPALL
jgi:Ser/Thr protein kinase RdoA (MazF antagonist)